MLQAFAKPGVSRIRLFGTEHPQLSLVFQKMKTMMAIVDVDRKIMLLHNIIDSSNQSH